MSTYGSVASGRRVTDDDVAKGMLRQGRMPFLARVKPAAGGGAKRTVTGTGRAPYQSVTNVKPGGRMNGNVQGVGKVDVEKAINPRGLLAAAKSPMQMLRGTASAKTGVRAGGLLNGVRAGRAGMGASSVASPANAGARLGQRVGMSIGANPMKAGLGAGSLGTAAVMGGNGHRNKEMGGFAPLAPMYGGFGKRSYDPENERHFRTGAYTAAAAGGGAALTGMGVRDVRRDTKGLRELPMVNTRVVPPELSPLNPKGAPRPPARLQARLAEIKNAEAHNAKVGELRGKLKGVQVTRRSGAKLGGGLALLGTAGALARNRHEERWD